MTLLQQFDIVAIEQALNRFAAVLSPRDLVFAVALPVLQMVGREWEAGGLAPSHEHLFSTALRSLLGGLVRTLARPAADTRALFAAPAGERHELGLLCPAVLAASHGLAVV